MKLPHSAVFCPDSGQGKWLKGWDQFHSKNVELLRRYFQAIADGAWSIYDIISSGWLLRKLQSRRIKIMSIIFMEFWWKNSPISRVGGVAGPGHDAHNMWGYQYSDHCHRASPPLATLLGIIIKWSKVNDWYHQPSEYAKHSILLTLCENANANNALNCVMTKMGALKLLSGK